MAIRIPTLDGPQVSQRGLATPYARSDHRSGMESISQGLGQAANGADRMAANYQRAQDEADVVAVNDALAELENDKITALHGDTREKSGGLLDGAIPNQENLDEVWEAPPGAFLATKGMQAAEKSSETMDWLSAQRSKRAGKLTTDKQRELFLRQSEKLTTGARNQVESHVSNQIQVAKQASLEGRQKVALHDVANNYADEELVAEQTEGVEEVLRALSLSDEDAEAKVTAWRSSVTEVRLNKYLAANDWKGAENLFAREKDVLGPHSVQFEKQIEAVKRDSVADAAAMKAVDGAMFSSGKVDSEKALAAIDAMDGDSQLKDEARRRTQQRIVQKERAWDAETEKISKESFAAYNSGGWNGIPAPLKLELNERNPELYSRLRNDSERRWKERNQNSAEARREQLERDRIARFEYLSLPAEERAGTDLDEFLAGRGASPVLSSELKVHKRKAGETVQKGEASSESESIRQAMAAAQGVIKGKKDQQEFRAEAALAFQRFQEQHKRAPSQKEWSAEVADMLLKEERPGLLFGTNEERRFKRLARERKQGVTSPERSPVSGVELEPKAPSGDTKKAVKYLYSPDRKMRVPIYVDGTKGSPEAVR